MKASLAHVLCALVLPSVLLVACGGNDSTATDMAANLDLPAAGDMPAVGCLTVPTWPNTMLFADGSTDPLMGYDFLTRVLADRAAAAGLVDTLRVELYHKTGMATTFPRTAPISATGTYNDCDDCVLIDLGQDFANSDPGTLYFARGGSLTVTKADRTPITGAISVSGTNVHFVQWVFDAASDKPVANGKCIDVGTFSFSSTYDNTAADGGTD